jgi:hypothetical protein
MSTTLDPNTEARPRAVAALSNGKLDLPPSQAATQAKFWRKKTPKSLRRGKLAADELWAKYFDKRTAQPSVAELCGADGTPLAWQVKESSLTGSAKQLMELAVKALAPKSCQKYLKGARRQQLRTALAHWLEDSRHAKADLSFALGCLTAAHMLDAVGEAIDATLGWRLIDFLTETARHAQPWSPDLQAAPNAALVQQLLAGELPLTLAYLFREMAPLWELRTAAADRLAEGMHELLNGRGLPRAAQLDLLRPLLACWTRCGAIGSTSKKLRWPKITQRQYEYVVQQAVRHSAADGTALLDPDSCTLEAELLAAALQLSGKQDKKNATAAQGLFGDSLLDGVKLKTGRKAATAADNCEWSRLTLRRSGWEPEAAAVAIDFSQPAMRIDVWADKRRLFGGVVATESHIGGQLLKPVGTWEEVCWFTDKDVNFAEYCLQLEGGARIERQILLAHRDKFLLLADHLQNSDVAPMEHAWQLPLGAGLLFCGEGETRDAVLMDGAPRSRLLPLALSEWRVDPRGGELSLVGNGVRLAEKTTGRSLACPLFIDLCPIRSALPCTWRQLTVAEALSIKSSDVAVSYRMQSGGDQWVYYRSQGPRGNRTFMGQNTSSECVIAGFKAPSGETMPLLELEG